MKKKIMLNIFALIVSISAQNNRAEEKTPIHKRIINFTSEAATFYATHHTLGALHEGGHLLTAKLAKLAGATIHNDIPMNIEFAKILKIYLGVKAQFPTFGNKNINALVIAASIPAALIGCYAALKLNNIYNSYSKNKSIKEAFRAGMKKDLINKEQSYGVLAAVGIHFLANTGLSLPFKLAAPFELESHGYQIGQDLGLIASEIN